MQGLDQLLSFPGTEYVPATILVGTLAVLIWATYTDIRANRISNIAILFLLCLGLGHLSLLVVRSGLLWWEALLMVLVPGVVAIFLYARQYWGAGDAKLFWMVSLLLPLKVYNYSYIIMPSTFLVASYATLFTYLSVWMAVVIIRERRDAFKKVLGRVIKSPWSLMFTLGFQFVGVIALSHVLKNLLSLNLGILQGLVLVPLVLFLLHQLTGKWWKFIFSPFVLYGGYLLVTMPLSASVTVLQQYILLLVLMVGREISDLVKWSRMKLPRLRPGVILEETVRLHVQNGNVAASSFATGPLPEAAAEGVLEIPPGPLSPDDYESLGDMLEQGPLIGDDLVKVRRTVPFAPAVLVGYLLVLYWFI